MLYWNVGLNNLKLLSTKSHCEYYYVYIMAGNTLQFFMNKQKETRMKLKEVSKKIK